MMPIGDLPPLRDVIRRHRLSAHKSLAQSFLLDLNLTARIARAGGTLEGVTVIEIGPGPGGLTRALLAQGARRVIAVERDRRAVAALEELTLCSAGRLLVIEGDAMTFDPRPHLDHGPVRVIANLPYNIATALLVSWLRATPWPPFYDALILTFQREVAERIVATHGTKAYGRLSILTQWRTEPKILFEIAPSAFVPPPKVTSSVVRLVPRAAARGDPRALERVTEAAFGQRRKMLRQSLKSLGVDPLKLTLEAGLDPTARAEAVPVQGFLALASALTTESRSTSNAPH
jgi:16S rRNA (adenine1518-N6/adenine1519-N6)-dimethyltransferase